VPGPNTSTHLGSAPAHRPATPTRGVVDAPTTRPDIRTGAKEFPIHSDILPERFKADPRYHALLRRIGLE
jgi:hypothetical protein